MEEIISENKQKLNNLEIDLDNLKKELDNLNLPDKKVIVINGEWKNVTDNLKIIYCGDNPGKEEAASINKYFVGKAGKILDKFREVHNSSNEEYVYFNKTAFHSNQTANINNWTEKEQDIVRKSIELTIECMFKLWEINKDLKIVILGISVDSSFVVGVFKEIILSNEKYIDFFNNMILLKHPSNNHLFSQIGEYLFKEFDKKKEIQINYEKLIKDISDSNKKDWEKLKTKD